MGIGLQLECYSVQNSRPTSIIPDKVALKGSLMFMAVGRSPFAPVAPRARVMAVLCSVLTLSLAAAAQQPQPDASQQPAPPTTTAAPAPAQAPAPASDAAQPPAQTPSPRRLRALWPVCSCSPPLPPSDKVRHGARLQQATISQPALAKALEISITAIVGILS